MKTVNIKFTHRGWMYGLPVYIAFGKNNDCLPIPIIPLTDWWIEYVAPAIQSLRSRAAAMLNIDTPERGAWMFEGVKRLDNPIVKSFEWDDDSPDWRGRD